MSWKCMWEALALPVLSRGSQVDAVAAVLPEPSSAILTRELLCSAVIRAATEAQDRDNRPSLRAAVIRRVTQATRLRDSLWT